MANIHSNNAKAGDVSRRDLLKLAGRGVALGACGLSMAELMFMKQVHGEDLINPWYDSWLHVFFTGGPSQTDTWDPTANNQSVAYKGFDGINLGVNDAYGNPFRISEVFPQLAQLVMNDPAVSLGVIRSMDHGSNNHGNGQRMMTSFWQGQLLNAYPSIAPTMAYFGENFRRAGQILPSVFINGNNGNGMNDARGARVPTALQVNAGGNQANNPVVQALSRPMGVDQARYARRQEMIDKLNAKFLAENPDAYASAYQKALADAYDITSKGQAAAAFDIDNIPANERVQSDQSAAQFTLSRELIKAGVPYISMGIGGNDTHNGNMDRIQRNWGDSFDVAIAQILSELKPTGKKVLVTAWGDFGRTPTKGGGPPGTDGRDHWGQGFSCAMFSLNQPRFVTTAIGDTGPDGLFTTNGQGRDAVPGLVDQMQPADLGWLMYTLMLGPSMSLGRPDGKTDIPTATGRNAPPADRTIALDPGGAPKLLNTFFPA